MKRFALLAVLAVALAAGAYVLLDRPVKSSEDPIVESGPGGPVGDDEGGSLEPRSPAPIPAAAHSTARRARRHCNPSN